MAATTATTFSATASAEDLYDSLLRRLKARPNLRIGLVLADMLPLECSMNTAEQLAQIDRLKAWLDSFRPLPADVLLELKQRYDVRLTYTSNAIEGNTLTQSETELVLAKGITVGGKTLAEHLEVIGHKEAIDYIETLSKAETLLANGRFDRSIVLLLERLHRLRQGDIDS